MDTYIISVNDQVVEIIEQKGRSVMAMCYILMDRVYNWSYSTKSNVEVYSKVTGGLYSV